MVNIHRRFFFSNKKRMKLFARKCMQMEILILGNLKKFQKTITALVALIFIYMRKITGMYGMRGAAILSRTVVLNLPHAGAL